MIELSHYIAVAALLFGVGCAGVLINRKNIVVLLMSVQIILLAAMLNFVAVGQAAGNSAGQVNAILVAVIAVAQMVLGLAITIAFFRNRGSVAVEDVDTLRG